MTVKILAILLAVLVLALAAQMSWADGPDQTIGDIISLPDGTPVTLCLETIVRIQHDASPTYIVLQEPFHSQDRILALTIPNSVLRLQQAVDVSGDLTTLPSGTRALENVTIWGYATATGQLLYHPPLIKGFGLPGETPWPKIDLTVASPSGTSGLAKRNRALDYTPQDDTDISFPQPTPYDTVDSVVNADPPLDEASLVALQCKPIVASGVETIGGVDYDYIDIMDDDGTSTLRAYYDSAVYSTAATALRLNYISGQIRSNGYMQTLCVNAGPDYDVQAFVGVMQPVGLVDYTTNPATQVYSIQTVLTQKDGTSVVFGSGNGKIVSASNADMPGYLYIQEPGRFAVAGIRVQGTSSAARGAIVDVTGVLSTGLDGEREIVASAVALESQSSVPTPLGMSNAALGGQLNYYGTIITNPPDVGCYNRGLLVKAWGNVTYVDPAGNYFYIWDGSNLSGGVALNDGVGCANGVRVECSWPVTRTPIALPKLGQYVAVTGLSGSASTPGSPGLFRVLRVRDQSDVVPAGLAVSITTPSGSTWHVASGADIVIGGMATDPGQTITGVQVAFNATGSTTQPGAGNWYTASYSASTHAWSYDWLNPQSQRIWVKATDSASNAVTTHLDVTIAPITVVYVNGSVQSSGTGYSWQTAKKHVNEAMTAASSGNEVWVAAGTYTESATISLKSGVGLYGGFTGAVVNGVPAETVREQRNWVVNKTTLDGSNSHSVVSSPSAAGSSACLDGFTIQNGFADRGGGIYITNSSPTISHNVVTNNNAGSLGSGVYCFGSSPTISGNIITHNGQSSQGLGGGMYCGYTSGASIAGNWITLNRAEQGGGVWCEQCVATVSKNIIGWNTAAYGPGAGIASSCPSDLTVSHNMITNNICSVGAGAGMHCYNTGAVLIEYNTIANNNSSDADGGGIYCDSGICPTISNNYITGNTGGIWCSDCSTTSISGNTIAANHIVGDGGADDRDGNDVGGGILCDAPWSDGSTVDISHNIVGGATPDLGNTSPFEGGGIFCENVQATIDSNLIQYNQSGTSTFVDSGAYYAGGGLALVSCDAGTSITNNVFANNTCTGRSTNGAYGGGAIFSVSTAPTVVNNTFANNVSGYWGTETPPVFHLTSYGGALHFYGVADPVSVINNIFYNNRAQYGKSVAFTTYATGSISCSDAYSDQGNNTQTYHYAVDSTSQLNFGSGSSACFYVNPQFCTAPGDPANSYWLQSVSQLMTTHLGMSYSNNGPVPLLDKNGVTRANKSVTMGAYQCQ